MPRTTKGSVYREKQGTVGIRWPEGGRRPQRGGFRTKTEARNWFDENVAPRLRRGGPSAEITLTEFVNVIYLPRWEADKAPRTRTTLREWLAPALETFGSFSLGELEGAASDIARWRANLPSADRQHKATRALRQVLAAAVRWGFVNRNPATQDKNPSSRPGEIRPFTADEVDRIVGELSPWDAAIVVFVSETGLRTNEWVALERRDIDRLNPAVAVARRFSRNRPTPYPKTGRRRVPLTPRAVEALSWLPARLDCPLLFPSSEGLHTDLSNWSLRTWGPALEAAGVPRRGVYTLRHTFATNALAAGVPIFQLSHLMGASVKTIERHYAAFSRESEEHVRSLLASRSGGFVESEQDGRGAESG